MYYYLIIKDFVHDEARKPVSMLKTVLPCFRFESISILEELTIERGDGAGEGGWLEAWNKGAGAWGGCLRAWGAGAWRRAGAYRARSRT